MSNSPAHILIVEDESDVREALLAQLQIEGHQVVEARSGSDALELVSQQSFDVVLTDVQMPGLNGIELLKRIAPMPSAPATIVMTGYGSVAMGIEAMIL
jgi:two-component system response regulator FlrC